MVSNKGTWNSSQARRGAECRGMRASAFPGKEGAERAGNAEIRIPEKGRGRESGDAEPASPGRAGAEREGTWGPSSELRLGRRSSPAVPALFTPRQKAHGALDAGAGDPSPGGMLSLV